MKDIWNTVRQVIGIILSALWFLITTLSAWAWKRFRLSFRKYKHSLNEVVQVVVWVIFYLHVGKLLRWIDPSARPFDAGTLQHLLYGIIGYFILKLVVHIDISYSHRKLNLYLQSPEIDKDFDQCTPYQRLCIYLWRLSLGLGAMSFLASL